MATNVTGRYSTRWQQRTLTTLSGDTSDVTITSSTTPTQSRSYLPEWCSALETLTLGESLAIMVATLSLLIALFGTVIGPSQIVLALWTAVDGIGFLALARWAFVVVRKEDLERFMDNVGHYLLFKVAFVGIVLEPQAWDFAVWTGWFTALGILRALTLMARSRLSRSSPHGPPSTWRLLSFLLGVLTADAGLLLWCVSLLRGSSLHQSRVLAFDCLIMVLDTVSAMTQCADRNSSMSWRERGSRLFNTGMAIDSLGLLVTMGHYLYIWRLNGISCSLIDLLLLFNLRATALEIVRRVVVLRDLYRASRVIHRCGMVSASTEELKQLTTNDVDCSICLGEMESASRLPCGHFFHHTCLSQWLRRATARRLKCTCPVCRLDLDNYHSGIQDVDDSGVVAYCVWGCLWMLSMVSAFDPRPAPSLIGPSPLAT
jgi:hypothetical protein